MSSIFISFFKLVQLRFRYYWNVLASFFPLLTLLSDGLNHVLPPTRKISSDSEESHELDDKKSLFPESQQRITQIKVFKNVHPCSLTFNTKLVPFKNSNGEMEWKFVEDNESAEKSPSLMEDGLSESLSPFMADSTQDSDVHLMFGTPFLVKEEQQQHKQEQQQLQEQEQEHQHQQHQQNLPSSSNSKDGSQDHSSLAESSKELNIHKRNRRKRVSSVVTSVTNGETYYHCSECPSKFKFRGYLTRHSKKHSQRKAYHCPFYESGHGKCSLGEGFSRRDTYKVHLKAMHFKYPKGVKCADRTGMMGWCGSCGQSFQNNEIWVERHIEKGVCRGLPEGYSSRIMTRNRKKTGKQSSLLNVANNGVNENPMLKLVMDGEVVSAPKLEDVTHLLGESGSTNTWTENSENASRTSSIHDLSDHSSASDSLSGHTSGESLAGSTNDSSSQSLDEAINPIGHPVDRSLFAHPNSNGEMFGRSWTARESSLHSVVDPFGGQVQAQVQAQIYMKSQADSQVSQSDSQKQVNFQTNFQQIPQNFENSVPLAMPIGDDDFPALDGENAYIALLQQHRQLPDSRPERAKPAHLGQDPLFHPNMHVSWLSQPDLTF
ncbi:Transcription factor [Komagataella phaffii CBS 7435]|uniref:Transcription factor n=2 Tax=Komagataella phaffii TaxID=460519 RepID=C4R4F4_KOMPG|nr:Transcription factor [Komagataella phaffii GS115]AOA63468.1 GQ67_03460T0 [Komagataella phaffii]CAH2449805.1 Transcription factor [Komagataella phaffii CBS 7435]AOA68994.1 GQ68_03430T0 [Komagataella phaffii GS115]CAY70440.1 Transcription factor [Komagataella phaffii GS115]SCV12255.1 Transcription factor [Komagataella phaffii CBS 7435]